MAMMQIVPRIFSPPGSTGGSGTGVRTMKVLSSLLAVLALALVMGCQSSERSDVSTSAMSDGASCDPAMCGGCPSADKGGCASSKASEADMGALSDPGGAACPSKPGCCPDAAKGCAKPCPEHASKHPQCDPSKCDPKNCDPLNCDPRNCDKPDRCPGR
jgi:hypothetical protein